MPRPARPAFAGATYHITARGNNGEPIFSSDEDRRFYLWLLARSARLMAVRLFAYALMTTHVHLVLQTTTANVSATIHRIHGQYAAGYNRRHRRTGHLFEARFHSELIEDEPYLLEATRYVHRNPVSAGIVRRPEDYLWSSYRTYVDPHREQSLVDLQPVLGLISLDMLAARLTYARFVSEGLRA